MAEYAAELSRQTGREIAYNAVTGEVMKGILTGSGLPEPLAEILVGVDASIAKGELVISSGDLSPMSRPIGPEMLAMSSSVKPASRSLYSRSAWARRLPMAQM